MANSRLFYFVFGLVSVFSCTLQANALKQIPTVVDIGNCRSNSDCGDGGCCVIGMMRYSVPYCQPLKQLGERCRPASSTPSSMILTYPNGLEVNLTQAHYIMCPCDASKGLFCNRKANAVCTLRDQLAGNGIS